MNLAALRHRIILKRGSDLLRKGDWHKASSVLGRAADLAPDHWESHNNLAIALLKLGRWEEAAGMAQRAIRLAPAAADSHDYFGIALLQMERWDEAVAAYRRAIRVSPDRYDSYDRLGIALLRLGRWREVAETYEAALKLDDSRHTAHERLGVALLHLGRREMAAAAFRRAIEIAGQGAAADIPALLSSLASAVAQGEGGASDAEATELRRAATVNPGAATRLSLAVELLKLGRWDEAVSELSEASAHAPDAGSVHFLQVDPLVRLGRFREATAAHQRAIAGGGNMPALPARPAAERFAQREAAFWSAENLGADVFAVERWLDRLAQAAEQAPAGPRLLFVLDNDFGELTTVKYVVLGQGLAASSTLLLPDRLYAYNADAIRGRTQRYASVDEILQVVDREHIEIVFLCSGYLLWEHLAFAPDDLARLVEQLQTRGCRVVTADPFLGMLSRREARSLIRIDVPATHPVWSAEQLSRMNRPLEERMWAAFAESERILRDVHHLYPSHCDVPRDDASETDVRNVAFFNDRLIRPEPAAARDGATPHWLFILTAADCGVQMLFEGETAFLDRVASKLVETLGAGRHPILIAPGDFVARLLTRMPTSEGIDIVSYCPFTRFMSLLLSAEHAFYWNSVSHSVLARLFNRLPIVLFDRGHLVRNAPEIRDRVVAWYYQGWEPPIRDHREPLTLETVEGWAAEYRAQSGRLVERFRRAPTPDRMIADLSSRSRAAPVGGVSSPLAGSARA